MTNIAYAWLVGRAFGELLRFDLIHGLFKVPHVRSRSAGRGIRTGESSTDTERRVCDAVVLACCLYWKPVLCLQRSVCAMRLLRARGVDARVVIGYRPVPFFSHAWVDVNGRVVNDSSIYQRRLTVLHTI